jgi:phosphate transport system substrate-binding protein
MPGTVIVKHRSRAIVACVLYSALCGCAVMTKHGPGVPAALQPRAQGAGATYPDPIYEKWIERYLETLSDPKPKLGYTITGSERGLELLGNHKVDYAGTDWPQDQSPTILQFPTVAGAVVIIYHIEGLRTDLRRSPETLGGILQGQIRRWNDPRLLRDNPDANLPARDIVLLHRAEGSGTTRILCEFARPYNANWQTGCDFTVTWPAGSTPVEGSASLSDTVFTTKDSISYVEYTYALTTKLQHALIRNAAGQFIQADSDSIAAAIPGFLPTTNAVDLARRILSTKSPEAYPMSALTWVLVPHDGSDRARRALKPFFFWTMKPEAQSYVELLGYVPLNASLREWEQAEVTRIP